MNTNEQNPDTIERPAEEGDFSRDPGIDDTPDQQHPDAYLKTPSLVR